MRLIKSRNLTIIRLFTLLLIFSLSFRINAQLGFEFNTAIPVKIGNKNLKLPWCGGLNHPQFSTFDFDFDGNEYLVIFDRGANQMRVFLHRESDGVSYYEYLHRANEQFPDDLRHRVALIDFNQDGKKDIFTYGIGGIKVYKNTSDPSSGISWELFSEVLESNYVGFPQPLFVSSIDIPAFVDIDNDGDIDVLTLNMGGQRMEYHKNMSMELYNHADSLVFVLENPCWGKFRESEFDNSITLNVEDGPCGDSEMMDLEIVERDLRHAGTTILALDLNNDNSIDLLLGDVDATNITALYSDGAENNENPVMTSFDANFPSNTTPVNLEIMPSSYFIDLDFDGVKDLIFASNVNGGSENRGGIQFYKNINTTENPVFVQSNTDFLHDEMIDNGRGSIPKLVDINGDGLTDLLVSSFYRYESFLGKSSGIQYFQNTGSEENPVFTFVTDDWLGLSHRGLGLRLFPEFMDVNDDGLEDLILGTETGEIYYLTRTGSGANQFSSQILSLKDIDNEPIQVNGYASPHAVDFNKNGKHDLLIGQRSGGLVYYENSSSVEGTNLSLVSNNLGNLDLGFPESFGVPFSIEVNDTLYLLVGSRRGNIQFYEDIRSFDIFEDWQPTTNNFSFIHTGAFSAPTIGQLQNDASFHLIVGGELGGLWAFKANEGSSPILSTSSESNKATTTKIYPNPVGEGSIYIDSEKSIQSITVINAIGKTVPLSFKNNKVDFSGVENGVYYIYLCFSDGSEEFHKVVK